MDEQKKPINQQASELEQRLKICEQSLSQEQFKLNLVNSIEKAVEKEKMILEVKINETELQCRTLQIENSVLKEELQSNSLTIKALESNLQSENQKAFIQHSKLSTEILTLKHKLEISLKSEENYRKTIENIKEKYNFKQKFDFKSSNSSVSSIELLKNEINAKELNIRDLENRLNELAHKNSELTRKSLSIDSEKSNFSQKISFLDESHKEISKKLQEAHQTISEKNQKIAKMIAENEKKTPVFLKQKENYEQLIISDEQLKNSYADLEKTKKKQEENIKNLNEKLKLSEEKESWWEKKSQILIFHLSNCLYSTQTTDIKDFSTIEGLLISNSNLSLEIGKYEEKLRKLSEKIQELEQRPLIIEEIVENIDFQKYCSLELIYQQQQAQYKELLKQKTETEFENQTLKLKLDSLKAGESKLLEIIDNLRKENSLSAEKISTPETFNIFPQPIIELPLAIKNYSEYMIKDYKTEIERLRKSNSDLYQSLKSCQNQLIQSSEKNKQKICEILNEKSQIYSELKKTQYDHQTSEENHKKIIEKLNSDLEKKTLESLKIDPKEFAAINELYSARETIKSLKIDNEKLLNQTHLLKEENNLLYQKLEASSFENYSKQYKSKIDESLQLSNILKYNCELYQEELRTLTEKNFELEKKLLEAQKDAGFPGILQKNDKEIRVVQENEADYTFYEGKINQLLLDLEKKDKQIVSLVSMIGVKECIPEMMTKIVTVLHKASKAIKNT